ncbi:tyrosine-protein phosphatase [Actinomadura violacea]|uniref:Tyrosine-protein phosphatase n=1 Tax=Actinomadura violacea TaxID=2819934 RepID=A0ABS3RP06_9ACTN|nr:tyrosine-protein phosphatase [Actinomadura violacea]MBO2458480.1 tyrosine-protein phosphatase [Actinomadura violacea]
MRSIRGAGAVALIAAGGLLASPGAVAAAPVPGAAPAAAAPVQDALQGTVNFRDLGGYRTVSHARVRSGLVFRTDALNRTTDADLGALARLGVREVVDFRTPGEVAGDGADRLPPGLAVTARPISDGGMYAAVNAAIGSKDPAKQDAALGSGRGAQIMSGLYRTFVSDAGSRAAFGRTLRDIADRSRTPLAFHCTSGKDRTGWMSYLLLRALGVPDATARYDYLLSNQYRRDADAATRAQLKAAGYMQNPDLLIPIQEVRPEYLDAALDQVRRSYGSLHRYLRAGLGIDGRTEARLRHELLTR